MRSKLVLVVSFALVLSGCDGIGGYLQLRDAKDAVASSLLDPSSAEFREIRHARYGSAGYVACGEVNSANAFGGKTGFRQFMHVSPVQRIASDAASGVAIRNCCSAVLKSGKVPEVKTTADMPECAGVEPMPLI